MGELWDFSTKKHANIVVSTTTQQCHVFCAMRIFTLIGACRTLSRG